jgi:ribosomal protein S4E
MVKREFYITRKDGVNLFRTYSDENYRILQEETGYIYDEAIDVENANYTYIETTDKIEMESEE